MTDTRVYRKVPPGMGVCPVCDEVVPWLTQRSANSPIKLFKHGPRNNRCPGSHGPRVPWLEATRLPKWDDLSDVDKGAILAFIWKIHWERSYAYARDNYPATFFDHPMLINLDVSTRCRYASAACKDKFGFFPGSESWDWPQPRRGGMLDMSQRGLGQAEWDRLYYLAVNHEHAG